MHNPIKWRSLLLSPALQKIIFQLLISLVFVQVASPAAAQDCTTSQSHWVQERPQDCLKSPGWIDIGAGYAVIENVANSQQNGTGYLVSIRAYPFGRWYAPLKSQTEASNALVKTKIDAAQNANQKLANAKSAAIAALLKAKATLKSSIDRLATESQTIISNTKLPSDQDLKKTAENLAKGALEVKTILVNPNSSASELKAATEVLTKDAVQIQAKISQSAIDSLAEAHNELSAAEQKHAQEVDVQTEVDSVNTDVSQGMQAALNDFGNNFAFEEHEWWVHLARRVSVFYGRSVSGFDPKVISGDINAYGIAYDIAPEFSLVWGRAFFNSVIQAQGSNATSSGVIMGVQLNLNAFKAMRGLTGSF